jgi:hypothetical protein
MIRLHVLTTLALGALTMASCAGEVVDAGAETDTPTLSLITAPQTSTLLVGVSGPTHEFAKIAQAGVRSVRLDHPSAATIEQARGYGIEVLPIAGDCLPGLNGTDGWKLPPLPQNYAAWAKWTVDSWRDMPNPPKVIEVWNEPWQGEYWGSTPNPTAYLALVKAFAQEAWAVWPTATLLVSGDEGQANYPTYRRDLLAADTSGFLNDPRIQPTTHNYVEARTPTEVTPQPCRWDLNRYECAYNDFKAHGHPNPQVWVTEFGWESDTPSPGVALYGAVSEQKQAEYMVEALRIFRASGKVAAAFSYLFQTGANTNYNWIAPNNREKPVVAAVRAYLSSGTTN